MKSVYTLCTALIGLTLPTAAMGEIVTMDTSMTVDNSFSAYISNDANSAGDLFLSGGTWQATDTGSFDFELAGTYYLHVQAVDFGDPEMFIGMFTLSNTNASFSNGTQTLLTGDHGDWTASVTGWGGADVGVQDLGPNGTGPWGNFVAMGDARFIWANSTSDTVYFSTQITVVPTPSVAGLIGLGGMTIARRRR